MIRQLNSKKTLKNDNANSVDWHDSKIVWILLIRVTYGTIQHLKFVKQYNLLKRKCFGIFTLEESWNLIWASDEKL